jgi:hypothetical protein
LDGAEPTVSLIILLIILLLSGFAASLAGPAEEISPYNAPSSGDIPPRSNFFTRLCPAGGYLWHYYGNPAQFDFWTIGVG